MGLGANELDLFLIGLLSSLAALLGRPLEELLEQLAVAENVRLALLRDTGPLGPVHAMVRAYERGDWENVTQAATALGLADGVLVEAYVQALQWAADTAAQVQQACG